MGCWSKTCGLSNLHINARTPVYVFVLEKSKNYNDCYSTSLFKPLLLPFEAEYNDHGGGENCCGVALPFIMSGIKEQLVEMELGDNQYHDIAVKKENFDDALFFNAVHEKRLQIESRFDSEPTQVYFTMMRKDIVDSILEKRELEMYVGDGKGTTGWGNNYIKYKFSDVVASVRPLLECVLTECKDDNTKGAITDVIARYRKKYLAALYLDNDGFNYSRIVDIKGILSKAINAGAPEAIDNVELLLIEHLKGLFIEGFMDSARKTWVPGGHEGSQSPSGSALRMLANATISVLDKEKAEYLAENECDESEYEE